MNRIRLPHSYNYIGIFLTLNCNLKCDYCVNHFDGLKKRKMIAGKDWVDFLNRLDLPDDLPITLQGGEPSLHPDFIYIINNIRSGLNIDVLTNLQFDVDEFIDKVDPDKLKRQALYASLRATYHPRHMSFDLLRQKAIKLIKNGFSVGLWGILYPHDRTSILESQKKFRDMGIDFRVKEFIGKYNGKLYGTYEYAGACDQKTKKRVLCKTSELLIDPAGNIYRCHRDLYRGTYLINSIFDPDIVLQNKFRECENFGFCNPCDVKIKTDRFQHFGHTSVEIKHND